jgi:hypothetical protein
MLSPSSPSTLETPTPNHDLHDCMLMSRRESKERCETGNSKSIFTFGRDHYFNFEVPLKMSPNFSVNLRDLQETRIGYMGT